MLDSLARTTGSAATLPSRDALLLGDSGSSALAVERRRATRTLPKPPGRPIIGSAEQQTNETWRSRDRTRMDPDHHSWRALLDPALHRRGVAYQKKHIALFVFGLVFPFCWLIGSMLKPKPGSNYRGRL